MRRTAGWVLAGVLLAGCGLLRDDDDRPRRGKGRRAATVARAAAGEGTLAPPREVALPSTRVEGPPRLILLVVLDTVRADHASLCGYGRPTTPNLARLAAGPRVASTCRMATPGTWTLPSHASFLTGLDPLAHTLISKARPLPAEVETLAETLAAEGWQTALFTANSTLNAESGIQQGFAHVAAAPGLHAPWRGAGFDAELSRFLDRLKADAPTFLVVNVFDAHDPYPTVPDGLGWVPPQPGVTISLKKAEGGPIGAYLTGAMPAAEEGPFLANLVDTYDYGVSLADRSLAVVLDQLDRRGFLAHGVRAVITSDHGENLGEHRSLRHDGQPWETVARVPLLFVDDTTEAVPTFPEPLPGVVVHHLLRHGRLPDDPGVPASYAIFHTEEHAWRKDSVALWQGTDKVMWAGGEKLRFDLAKDPSELAPGPVGAAPLAGELDARAARLLEVKARVVGKPEDAGMKGKLEALGYVE